MIRKKQVVLIGDNGHFPEKNDIAYEIGKYIARNQWVLITGGRGGVMEAACRGAAEENGITVSIVPSDNFNEANPYSTIVIPTGIGFARNYTNALSADVIVAVGGGSGTLCEMSYGWQYQKPMIACSFVEGYSREFAGRKMDYRNQQPVLKAESLEDVLRLLDSVLRN
jgi:uncharacterized protein (TIGR00725 family)